MWLNLEEGWSKGEVAYRDAHGPKHVHTIFTNHDYLVEIPVVQKSSLVLEDCLLSSRML